MLLGDEIHAPRDHIDLAILDVHQLGDRNVSPEVLAEIEKAMGLR